MPPGLDFHILDGEHLYNAKVYLDAPALLRGLVVIVMGALGEKIVMQLLHGLLQG